MPGIRSARSADFVVSCWAAFILIGGSTARAQNDLDIVLTEAKHAFESLQYPQAVEAYRRAVEDTGGTSIEALAGLGLAASRIDDLSLAAESARRLLTIAPRAALSVETWNELGLALMDSSDTSPESFRHAEVAFRNAVDVAETNMPALQFNLVDSLFRQGEYGAATRLIDDYVSAHPGTKWSNRLLLFACQMPDAPTSRHRLLPPGQTSADGSSLPPIPAVTPLPSTNSVAKKNRTKGTVELLALIRSNGDVGPIRVIDGLPDGLTESAVNALLDWKFVPAERNGERVASCYQVGMRFGRSGQARLVELPMRDS